MYIQVICVYIYIYTLYTHIYVYTSTHVLICDLWPPRRWRFSEFMVNAKGYMGGGKSRVSGPKSFFFFRGLQTYQHSVVNMFKDRNVHKVGPRADRFKWSEITSINGFENKWGCHGVVSPYLYWSYFTPFYNWIRGPPCIHKYKFTQQFEII